MNVYKNPTCFSRWSVSKKTLETIDINSAFRDVNLCSCHSENLCVTFDEVIHCIKESLEQAEELNLPDNALLVMTADSFEWDVQNKTQEQNVDNDLEEQDIEDESLEDDFEDR